MIEHLDTLGPDGWEQIRDGEEDPFALGEAASAIEWRGKTQQTVRRDADGRMLAKVGMVIADVEAGGETFPVAGVGGVIVTHSRRGKGLLRPLLEAALEHAMPFGPERALLWCTPRNVPVYARLGFFEIDAPVFVQQPAGELRMPLSAMWRPLRAGATWPAGEVRVPGLPF